MKYSLILAVFLFGLAAADNHDTTGTTTTTATTTTTTTTTADPATKKRSFQSPLSSFFVQSDSLNAFDSSRQIGAILGFAAFGVAFLITVVMIFRDINKRKCEYEEMIQDDRATMTSLGIDEKMAELSEELKKKLSGVKEEDAGDDQLMGEAAKLGPSDFAQFKS